MLDIKTMQPLEKFSHCRLGPFKVTKVVSEGTAYKLDLSPCYPHLHLVFPVVKLEPAVEDDFPGCAGYNELPLE